MSVALSLLLVYDTLLSLDQEVEYIWNGELSSVKILYFCTRYGIICSSMISMACKSRLPEGRRYSVQLRHAVMFPTGMSSRVGIRKTSVHPSLTPFQNEPVLLWVFHLVRLVRHHGHTNRRSSFFPSNEKGGQLISSIPPPGV